MKSNWVSANQVNDIPWVNEGELTNIIDELIDWYDENSTRKEDDYNKAQLKSIRNLAENIESSEEIWYLKEIFKLMCEIVERQREVISELEDLARSENIPSQQTSFMALYTDEDDVDAADVPIKTQFIAYMKKDKRAVSTIHDYTLRVQNLWNAFYADYRDGRLPEALAESMSQSNINPNAPLWNASQHLDELNCYVSMKMSEFSGNRNWANIRAAYNAFGNALLGDSYEKVKSEPKEQKAKDFSKYMFGGETYGKSRLVLAVVKQFVEDHNPETFKELEAAFPSQLQGSLGVVKRMNSVSDKYKGAEGGVKRYFIKQDEIIYLPSGEQVIICTQWGANIERFIESAKKLGYEIIKV